MAKKDIEEENNKSTSYKKTAKKPMKLKTSVLESSKDFAIKNLSKREIKALAWVKALKDIAEACKAPKFNLAEESKKVIQRTISAVSQRTAAHGLQRTAMAQALEMTDIL